MVAYTLAVVVAVDAKNGILVDIPRTLAGVAAGGDVVVVGVDDDAEAEAGVGTNDALATVVLVERMILMRGTGSKKQK